MLAGRRGRTPGYSSNRRLERHRPAGNAHRGRLASSLTWLCIVVLVLAAAVAGGTTKAGDGIVESVGRFLLFYAGVFALLALTASVGAGLLATGRLIFSPGGRIIAQAVHRAVSLAAVGFLAIHIVLEVLAGRSAAEDSVVPFLDHSRTLYLGLGTVASDLVLLVAVTGVLRGRFAATRHRWGWRALHAVAYLAWPLAILHGLLAGRTAKPYVDWSYGACAAAVAVALVLRLSATRVRETAAIPVAPPPWPPAGPALPSDVSSLFAPSPGHRALPPGHREQRALPAGDPLDTVNPPGRLPR